MKFYISSRTKHRLQTKELADTLKSLEHSVTLDWTKYPQEIEKDKKESAKISQLMIEAIKKCDVFILFPDDIGGTGMYVELGIALSENKKIIVVADAIKKPIFMFHPNIIHVKSEKELLNHL